VRDRPQILGVDLHVDHSRAEALGIEVRELDARDLDYHNKFDAVVSTQMLDDVAEWQDVLRRMADALCRDGTLFLTCDSGDTPRPWWQRLRGVPAGPTLEQLAGAARDLGLQVEAIRRYGRRDLKRRQGELDGAGRLATLELEESIEPADARDWGLLYLRATRPPAR
jgi:SAM-dependent methyltransferase